jgi:putative ABC transport system substrate-binding protein
MNRRRFLAGAGLLALAGSPAAQARVPKIGYLLLVPLSESPSRERQAFLDGLRAHGYVPGKTIEIVYASAQNAPEFLDDVCQDLLAQKVDLIVTAGALATLSAKKCARSVPVVIQALGDPIGIGLVRSLSRPEGNVTGVAFLSTDLAPKRIELLRELLPDVKRVAVLWDARDPNAIAEAGAVVDAIKAVKLSAQAFPLQSDAELGRLLGQLKTLRTDALYAAFEAGLVGTNRRSIAEAALAARIPVVSGYEFLTEAGGLVSYAPDIPDMFRRSASYVHRILKGAKPSELPIELPRNVELVVNVKTARALGMAIPHAFLVRADRVIE